MNTHDATKHWYGPKRKVSNKQFSLTKFFHENFPKFPQLLANLIPDISLAAVKFPNISGFSRNVVIL